MSYERVQMIPVQNSSASVVNSGAILQEFKTQKAPRKLRVAAYCRVSTEEELQLGSLENQIIHYTNYIRGNPEWYYAGVYSDKGKSGTEMSKRIGFNRMIRNAMNGEIDIIICKSISRFARNVVDTIDIVNNLLIIFLASSTDDLYLISWKKGSTREIERHYLFICSCYIIYTELVIKSRALSTFFNCVYIYFSYITFPHFKS